MNKMSARLSLLVSSLFIFALQGCSSDAGDGASADVPGFVQLSSEVFSVSCAGNACHSGGIGAAGLSFDDTSAAYSKLVGGEPINAAAAQLGLKLVFTEKPKQSYLLHKITTDSTSLAVEGLGARMPIGGLLAPGENSIQAITDWIAAGAPYEGVDFDADFTTVEQVDIYVACDATDERRMLECFGPTPEPTEVMRLHTRPIQVAAGEEILLCSHLPDIPQEDVFFRALEGRQMSGGHHVALYAAFAPIDSDEPVPCGTGAEMENYRFIAGAFSGGAALIPDNVAVRLPAGQQVVIQSHYINPTDEPLIVMDVLDLELVDDADPDKIADNLVLNLSEFEVPPQSVGHEVTYTCAVGRELDIYSIVGHTHEHGTLLELEYASADGDSVLYSETDGILMREGASAVVLDTPLHLLPDDELTIRCRWDNPFNEPLGYPTEMCAAIMYYTPAVGFLVCGEGDDVPQIFGADTGQAGCQATDAVGNALGVGKACTSVGGECVDNGDAELCLAMFDAAANFCSFLGCGTDGDCGADAICREESGGTACVPLPCAD